MDWYDYVDSAQFGAKEPKSELKLVDLDKVEADNSGPSDKERLKSHYTELLLSNSGFMMALVNSYGSSSEMGMIIDSLVKKLVK